MSSLRFPYYQLSKEAYAGFISTKNALSKSVLGAELIELIYLRVSQINGCAFCLEMHTASLRKSGISENKLAAVAGWRVSHHFSEKERSALNWAESLVYVDKTHIPDQDFEQLKAHFNEIEISDLCFAVALMSAFNRLAIAARQ